METTRQRAKKLTKEEKIRIIEFYRHGYKPEEAAKILNRSSNQISTFYSRWKFNSTLPPKDIIRDHVITGRLGLKLKDLVLKNPKLGSRKLAQKLKDEAPNAKRYIWGYIRYPSASSILRFLKENGFKRRKAYLKPPLTEASRAKRLAFAQKWMQDGHCTLENVIWTDESRVASHPNNRRISLWTNTADPAYQVKMHSGGNSVMFWGSFSKHGTGKLVSLVGTMDSAKYIEVLDENLVDEFNYAKDTYSGAWRLMQDNAPCHTSKSVKAFLRERGIKFIDWPPYSPDLNPIENIWHWMKTVLETEYPVCVSAEEIEARFHEIWATITPEMCQAYCGEYERRLQAVIAANGGYTKY